MAEGIAASQVVAIPLFYIFVLICTPYIQRNSVLENLFWIFYASLENNFPFLSVKT
jgi:hypothetical protein